MNFRPFAPIAICATVAAATVLPVRAEEKIPQISQAELTQAIKDKSAVVVDVNGNESYKSGHIPTAINYAAVKTNFAAALPADKGTLVVAYCGSPKCGAYKTAADAAMKLGYTNVKHFSPGIKGWKESGATVEKG